MKQKFRAQLLISLAFPQCYSGHIFVILGRKLTCTAIFVLQPRAFCRGPVCVLLGLTEHFGSREPRSSGAPS